MSFSDVFCGSGLTLFSFFQKCFFMKATAKEWDHWDIKMVWCGWIAALLAFHPHKQFIQVLVLPIDILSCF